MEYLENELVLCKKENVRLQREIRLQKFRMEFQKLLSLKDEKQPNQNQYIKSEHDKSKMEREIMHLNKLLSDKDKEIV